MVQANNSKFDFETRFGIGAVKIQVIQLETMILGATI